MTLKEIKLLHAYNSWANNRIFDGVGEIPGDELTRDMKSSHSSIYGTLLHMVAAEKIWLSRWIGTSDATMLTQNEAPTLAILRDAWEKVGYETARFLGVMTDKKLNDTFSMKTSAGKSHQHVFWQAFQHVVDHSTYHRGQVITLMRQLGMRPPPTGLILFYRETGKLH